MELQSRFPLLDIFEPKFEAYISSVDPFVGEMLTKQSEPLENILDILRVHYLLLNYVADCRFIPVETHRAVKMLCAKTTSDILAIYTLLKSGCNYQASMILRTMFETTANVLFIYEDFDRRIELFYNHRFIEQNKKLKKDPDAIDAWQRDTIIDKFNKYKGDYDKNSPWYHKELRSILADPKQDRKHQKRLTLRDLSRFVGLEEDYERIYGSTSLSVHGSAVLDHMFINKEGFSSAPIFDREMTKNIAGLAISYANRNLEKVLSRLDHPEAAEVVEYLKWLQYSIMFV